MTVTCIVLDDERPCLAPVTLTEPVPLCDEHKLQVALTVVPDLLTSAFRDARALSSRTLAPDVVHMVTGAQAVATPTTDPHGSLVYFMANGGRVKIGYTKSLFSRISALSLREDAVLLLLRGGLDLERALHAKFGAYRVADSEWFELAPEVVHFIADKAPKHRNAPRGKRPSRVRAAKKASALSKRQQQSASLQVIRDLFEAMGRRPLESEMVDALKGEGLPHSRAQANRLRLVVEAEEPKLATLGSDNVRTLTGS